jgi:hypothetical protein
MVIPHLQFLSMSTYVMYIDYNRVGDIGAIYIITNLPELKLLSLGCKAF